MIEEKKRVLVVDDDVGILRVFRNILQKEGTLLRRLIQVRLCLKKLKKKNLTFT